MYPNHTDYISFKKTHGLKIRGESAWPMFFGFVAHKTSVEYFGVLEFAKPQTKTRSRLSTSIHPSVIRRLRKGVWEERWGGHSHPVYAPWMPFGRLSGPMSLSLRCHQRVAGLTAVSSECPGELEGAGEDAYFPLFIWMKRVICEQYSWLPAPSLSPSPQWEPEWWIWLLSLGKEVFGTRLPAKTGPPGLLLFPFACSSQNSLPRRKSSYFRGALAHCFSLHTYAVVSRHLHQ